MKKKFRIKTIEDIAIQFIKQDTTAPPKNNIINSNKTILDSKLFIKQYINNKNKDLSLSQNYEKLILYENKEDEYSTNKLKIITFYKLPPKILGDDDELNFDSCIEDNNSQILSHNTKILISNGEIKLREIKPLIYNNNLFFNINYQNAYDCLSEIYSPLLLNLESISSLKSMVDNSISRIEFFCSHSSIFDLNDNNNQNYINHNNNIILEIMEELKIFEIIEFSLLIFLFQIILEVKIEYLDNFNEDDIIIIYQDSYLALQKLYEIIILILLINENNNNKKNNKEQNLDNISFESLCSKYIKEFYKFEDKPNSNEDIINIINENITSILKILFNSCNILFGYLISFKKNSGNLEFPDDEEIHILNILNNNNTTNLDKPIKKEENIILSKEFNDQYICYKTIYLYFTKDKKIENNKTKNSFNKEKNNEINIKDDTEINYEFLSPTETNILLTKLTDAFSLYKELSNCFLLYYSNFKILIEKNKVKPPYLPPLDSKRYKYTLVLDLDETLVHYIEEENRAYVQVRPYADYFLSEMGKYFEIVIFTAASEDYADIVLNELDKNNVINYKLYRKHTEQINGIFMKDLTKLGRDLSKVIIIDNNKDNFTLQPENGLHISSFLGDQNDDELYVLTEDLMKIVNSNKNDIRPIIREIDYIMKKRYEEKNIALE